MQKWCAFSEMFNNEQHDVLAHVALDWTGRGRSRVNMAPSWDAMKATILGAVNIFALCGNVSLFVVLLRKPALRTQNNMFLLNLAAADLLVSVVNMPMASATLVHGSWMFGEFVCTLTAFVNLLSLVASVMSLAMVSVNRYNFVVNWRTYHLNFTKTRCAVYVVCVWVFSGLLCLPPLFGWAEYRYNAGQSQCFVNWSSSASYTMFMVLVCFFGPLSTMALLYWTIWKHAKVSIEVPHYWRSECKTREGDNFMVIRQRIGNQISGFEEDMEVNLRHSPTPKLTVKHSKDENIQGTADIAATDKRLLYISTQKRRKGGNREPDFDERERINVNVARVAGAPAVGSCSTEVGRGHIFAGEKRGRLNEDGIGDTPEAAAGQRTVFHDERRLQAWQPRNRQRGYHSEKQGESSAVLPQRTPEIASGRMTVSNGRQDQGEERFQHHMQSKREKKRQRHESYDLQQKSQTIGHRIHHWPQQEQNHHHQQQQLQQQHHQPLRHVQQPEHQPRACGNGNQSLPRTSPQRPDPQFTRTLIIVVLVFCICWGPYAFTIALEHFLPTELPAGVSFAVLLLGYSNSFCNVVIYFSTCAHIRKEFKNLFRCCCSLLQVLR